MTLYETAMRIRIRDKNQDTPMGLWGIEGEIVGVENPPSPGGEYTHTSQQVYSVLFDGEKAPMKVFEAWIEMA